MELLGVAYILPFEKTGLDQASVEIFLQHFIDTPRVEGKSIFRHISIFIGSMLASSWPYVGNRYLFFHAFCLINLNK